MRGYRRQTLAFFIVALGVVVATFVIRDRSVPPPNCAALQRPPHGVPCDVRLDQRLELRLVVGLGSGLVALGIALSPFKRRSQVRQP